MKTLVLLMFLSMNSYAAGWYCSEVASEWMDKGKILSTCGIGIGFTENEARLNAYKNSRKEFDLICGKGTTCANKVIAIDPQRTACTQDGEQYTCHRLFWYHITNKVNPPPEIIKPKEKIKLVDPVKKEEEFGATKPNSEPSLVQNIYNQSYIVFQPPAEPKVGPPRQSTPQNIEPPRQPAQEKHSYKTFIRRAGGVSIYQTNSREYQGVYLTNPENYELEAAITRGNRSGNMNVIYIDKS